MSDQGTILDKIPGSGLTVEEGEIVRAIKYLALKDEKKRQAEIAIYFNLPNERSVQAMVARWKHKGILDKAREIYLMPVIEDTLDTQNKVLRAWGDIVERMVKIASQGKEHNAIEAYKALYEHYVKPAQEAAVKSGEAELIYTQQAHEFDPMIIEMPAGFPVLSPPDTDDPVTDISQAPPDPTED